jgi:alpha-tubulin suppressor-like RCC1 family protein
VSAVRIHPDSIVVHLDSTVSVAADVMDDNGHLLTDRPIAWLMFDTTIARLNEDYSVTGLQVGPTELVAASESAVVRAPVAVVVGLTSIAMGSRVACAVSDGARAYCWGVEQGFPRRMPGLPTVQAVYSGLNHHCALSVPGAAFCWGGSALPGNGSDTAVATPVEVTGGLTYASLGLGWYHTCGLTTGASIYCWGGNEYGSTGGPDPISTPRVVSLSGAAQSMTTGAGHTCALIQGGTVSCWGYNRYGQLGTSVDEHVCPRGDACSRTPTNVDSLPALVSVTAGYWHTCGLTADGNAYCWGANYAGQLGTLGGSGCQYSRIGDSTFACSEVPRAVQGGRHFTSIAAGESHTCGLVAGGALYCWGDNSVAQFGNGDRSGGSATPVPAAGSLRFRSLSASDLATCGITADTGVAYCWGSDWFNTLGNGDALNQNSATPVRVLYQP